MGCSARLTLDASGTVTIIFPINNPTYEKADEAIAELCGRYPGKLIGFAKHDPQSEAGRSPLRAAACPETHFLHVPQRHPDIAARSPGRGHLLTQPGVAMRIDHQGPRLRGQSTSRLRTRQAAQELSPAIHPGMIVNRQLN